MRGKLLGTTCTSFFAKICITPTSRGLIGCNSFDGTDYMKMDKMSATQKRSQKKAPLVASCYRAHKLCPQQHRNIVTDRKALLLIGP